jgi:hypothetical protein
MGDAAPTRDRSLLIADPELLIFDEPPFVFIGPV